MDAMTMLCIGLCVHDERMHDRASGSMVMPMKMMMNEGTVLYSLTSHTLLTSLDKSSIHNP